MSFDIAADQPALPHRAKGYIAKPELGKQLVPGVRAVYDDGTAWSVTIARPFGG